eukprot:363128-Chlamydomonas_euryale.AAC.1
MWKQKEGQLARYLSVVGQLAKSQTLRLTLRASSRRAMAERMMDVDLGSENSGEDLGPQCRGGRPRLEERWRKSMAQRMMEDDYGHHHQSTHCPCVDEDAFQVELIALAPMSQHSSVHTLAPTHTRPHPQPPPVLTTMGRPLHPRSHPCPTDTGCAPMAVLQSAAIAPCAPAPHQRPRRSPTGTST